MYHSVISGQESCAFLFSKIARKCLSLKSRTFLAEGRQCYASFIKKLNYPLWLFLCITVNFGILQNVPEHTLSLKNREIIQYVPAKAVCSLPCQRVSKSTGNNFNGLLIKIK